MDLKTKYDLGEEVWAVHPVWSKDGFCTFCDGADIVHGEDGTIASCPRCHGASVGTRWIYKVSRPLVIQEINVTRNEDKQEESYEPVGFRLCEAEALFSTYEEAEAAAAGPNAKEPKDDKGD